MFLSLSEDTNNTPLDKYINHQGKLRYQRKQYFGNTIQVVFSPHII